MNKMEFFKILEEGLIDFPAVELQDILYDYTEHFANAQSEGKTEEEIINELGDPYTIVNQYRSSYIQTLPKKTKAEETKQYNHNNYKAEPIATNNTANTILKILILTASIILLFPVVTSIFSAILGIGVALLVIPFALSISGIVMLLGSFGFTVLGFGLPPFFADFPISAIILVTIGSITSTILFFILLIYIIKFIILTIKKLINKLSNKEGK